MQADVNFSLQGSEAHGKVRARKTALVALLALVSNPLVLAQTSQSEANPVAPPGASIEAKEFSRKGASGKDLVVKHHLFVKGAPDGVLLQEIQWPVNADNASGALAGISIGKDGILTCAGRTPLRCGDPKNPDDPVDFIVTPRKGEPTRLIFVSDAFKIGIVIVADPIQAADKGCTLNIVRLTSRFELGFVSGSGYAPNADIHYRFTSETTSDHVIKSDGNGEIRFSVIPFPGKKQSGVAHLKITEPACSPEVQYDWGVI
jgi:hypothetical protein